MTKTKKSILNAIVALLQMLVTCVVGMMFNKSIMSVFGSVYNGVNATITQIINAIMIVEGGFTLASNVALFEPWEKKDTNLINGILSATKKRFCVIGWLALGVGLLVAVVYSFSVKSTISYWLVFGLMLTVLLPTCINLGVTTKYRVILLTEQKEYIISIISTVTYLVGNLVAIFAIHTFGCSLLFARIIIMFSLLANYFAIGIYCKIKYSSLSFAEEPLTKAIKGTNDVIVMKLTSVVYSTAPIVIISLIPQEGLILASVYAVYNSVMSIVNGGLKAIVNAPRLSFGALFAQDDKRAITQKFIYYERITFIGLTVILGTTALLIMPFVAIYTSGINDAEYLDVLMAVLLIAKNFVEISHIPSGQMIQMSGDFRASKKIQTLACIVLVVTLTSGLILGDVYFIVLAILCAALTLAVLEIVYVERKVIGRGKIMVVRNFLPATTICFICCIIGMTNRIECSSYLEFCTYGIILVCALLVCTVLLYYVLDRKGTKQIVCFLISSIKGRN